jgi:cell division protein FtsQ
MRAPGEGDAMTTTSAPDREDVALPEPRPTRWWLRRRVVVPGAIIAVVLAVVWVVVFSPLLGVRTIAVRGAHGVLANQVQRAAAIAHGTPLVRLDTGMIARRVEQIPAVRSAQVHTSFPSTVTITVLQRRPVGWLRIGGRDVLVDGTGVRYRSVSTRPAHLPLLVLPPGSGSVATTAAVAAVAADLPARLLPRIASVQALDPRAITLLLRGDVVVHWGSAANSPAKARILPVLLQQLRRHGGTQIDVSDPRQPFVH